MAYHRRKQPQMVAHKGNSWDWPENTRSSIVSAIELGADMVEIDVSVTSDGVAVLVHGPLLESTTTGVGRVAETPFAVIRQLRALDRTKTVTDELVPTFAAIFREFGAQTAWNIDIKDDGAIEQVVDAVTQHDLEDRVVFSGSTIPRVRRVLRLAHDITVLIDLDRLDKAAASWPWFRPHWFRLRYGRTLGQPNVGALNVSHRFVDQRLVERVHAMGSELWTFTVDDPARQSELRGFGVDSITSNRVSKQI